jgi:hypothetical protein
MDSIEMFANEHEEFSWQVIKHIFACARNFDESMSPDTSSESEVELTLVTLAGMLLNTGRTYITVMIPR